jgi:hypothetical protein
MKQLIGSGSGRGSDTGSGKGQADRQLREKPSETSAAHDLMPQRSGKRQQPGLRIRSGYRSLSVLAPWKLALRFTAFFSKCMEYAPSAADQSTAPSGGMK